MQQELMKVTKEGGPVVPVAEEPQHQGVSLKELHGVEMVRVLRPWLPTVPFPELEGGEFV